MAAVYLVEYIVRGRKTLHGVQRAVKDSIIEAEDEIDDGEEPCDHFLVVKADDGEFHLYMWWVKTNWQPGEIYERLLRKKLREVGCELELLPSM